MSRHVLEYKRAIKNSKVCYRQSVQRQRTRPNRCREGFQWDQGHTCWPSPNNGADCWGPCGFVPGMCESYCGAGRACCRVGYGSDPAECQGASGFISRDFTKGSPRDYHQCVTPGPALTFTISGCGELRANGLWVQSGQHRNRPRYTKVQDKNTIIEWSEKREVWRLYVDNTWFGVGRATLYQSDLDTKTVPMSLWKAVDGLPQVPVLTPWTQPGAETKGSSLAEIA